MPADLVEFRFLQNGYNNNNKNIHPGNLTGRDFVRLSDIISIQIYLLL